MLETRPSAGFFVSAAKLTILGGPSIDTARAAQYRSDPFCRLFLAELVERLPVFQVDAVRASATPND